MASPAVVSAAEYVKSATAAAGTLGYDLLNGRSERRMEESTPTKMPAALRLVEAITRPISAAEALSSPAVAQGLAAEQFEDE